MSADNLKMIPNASYPLKSSAKRCGLPPALNWNMISTSPALSDDEMKIWISFLLRQSWQLEQAGRAVYAGTELVWAYILGWVVYLRGYTSAGGTGVGNEGAGIFTVGCTSFTAAFATFHEAMVNHSEEYRYPGWAPSTKYAIVGSRSHYLAYLVRNEEHDVLLPLLRLVTRMVRASCSERNT